MAGFFDFLSDAFGKVVSDPSVLGTIATGMEAGGKFAAGQQKIDFGKQQRVASQFEADQLRYQGGQELAASERQAAIEDRSAKYLSSETLARAAASGGGASDPTVVNIMAQQAAEGAYRSQTALYNGAARQHMMELQAASREYQGASQEASTEGTGRALMLGAGTSLLRGFARDSSLFQRFGNGGPSMANVNADDY